MLNILFTCAGRRTYLLKYFKELLGDEGLIVATDLQATAPALTAADVSIQVPPVYDKDYIGTLVDICKQYKINALISLNDLELPILAQNKNLFDDLGVNLIVSSQEVIDICFDKYKTAKYIQSIGLNSPKTFVNYKDAIHAIHVGQLSFPLVLKPRWGSGSIGIEYVNDMSEFINTYSALLNKIKKTILATASQGDKYILIQEKISGHEYGLDIMNDLKGTNRGVSVKLKLAMRAGETDKARTIDNPDLWRIGKTLGDKLQHIGNLDADVLEQDGQYYVLELNPRFGGGFPFSYEAGVNFPHAIIEWLKGNDVDDKILIPRYNATFAKCDHLVSVD